MDEIAKPKLLPNGSIDALDFLAYVRRVEKERAELAKQFEKLVNKLKSIDYCECGHYEAEHFDGHCDSQCPNECRKFIHMYKEISEVFKSLLFWIEKLREGAKQ